MEFLIICLFNSMSRLGNVIEKVLKFFLFIIFSFMVTIVIVQIFRRYIFGSSFSWVEEAARYLFIWTIFIASAIGIKEKSHSSVEFLLKKMKTKKKNIIIIIKHLLMIFFFLTVVNIGINRTITSFGGFATSFPLSKGWVYLAIPTGGFFMFYYEVIELIRSILLIKGNLVIKADLL